MSLPTGQPPGMAGFWGKQAQNHLRRERLHDLPGQNSLPNGTVLLPRRWKRRAAGGSTTVAAPIIYNFQPYAASTDPSSGITSAEDNPEDAGWWRTIEIAHGTVNNIGPVGDGEEDYSDEADTDYDHKLIVLNAGSTTNVWLECAISDDLDDTEGSVLSCALYVSDSGWWDDYPNEPAGDSDTGAPPDTFYIALYSIETSDDPEYSGSGAYPAGTLTFPTAWDRSNYWVDEVSYGNIQSGSNGCYTNKRMSLHSA